MTQYQLNARKIIDEKVPRKTLFRILTGKRMKSVNIDIWEVGTSNQLFIRGS